MSQPQPINKTSFDPPSLVIQGASAAAGRASVSMPETDFSSLKVVELKELCRKKGLPVSGKKAELIERLEQATETQADEPTVRPRLDGLLPLWCSSQSSEPTAFVPPTPALLCRAKQLLSLRPQRPLRMQSPAHQQHLQHPARPSQPPRSWRICLAHSKSRRPQPRSRPPQGAPQRLWGTMQQPLQMWWRHPPTTPLRQSRTRLLTRAACQPSLSRQPLSQIPLQRPPRLGHQRPLQQQT